ncbi:MAG: porin [Burkholderiaceae bacterium]
MNKLLPIALLLGAAGVAQAQVTVYGLVDMSYGKNLSDDAAVPSRKADFHSGGDDNSGQGNSASRVGVKGSTDLGSGIKGNFKFETAGITSNGEVGGPVAQPFFNRQAWIGGSGSFGEVRLGRQDSVPFQTMIDFDFNGAANMASALGNSLIAPWMAPRGRQSRSLQYMAPEYSNVKVHVGFQPEDHTDLTTKANFSIGAKYSIGPLSVGGTAETKRTDLGKNFMAVAGSYDFKVVKVMASYANSGSGASGGSGKGIGLGVVAPVAGFNIGAHVGKNTDDLNKITAIELFANREILKNTYAYLDIGRAEDKSLPVTVKATGFALGVIYVF